MTRILFNRNLFFLIIAALSGLGWGQELPTHLSGNYSMTWNDEFAGPDLDTDKWFHRLPGSRNDAINTSDAVSVSDGKMTITTYTEDGKHYTGMIATNDSSLNQTYGYYEVSAEFLGASGMWSAFWLQSNNMGTIGNTGKYGSEIDVVEFRNVPRNSSGVNANANSAFHWHGYAADHQNSTKYYNDRPDLLDGYHTYGVLWNAGGYTFYIDGEEVWRTTEAISSVHEFIILSSEVNNGSWASNIPASGYGSKDTSSTKMNVDYVRVYGLSDSTWDASKESGNWSAANWNTKLNTGGTSNMAADAGNIWVSNTTDTAITLDTDARVDSLTIRNQNNLKLTGPDKTLTINGGIAILDKNDVTFDANVEILGHGAWTLFEGGSVTVNGKTQGDGNLTLQQNYGNGGTYTFNGTSTRTGTTIINNKAAVRLAHDSSLGSGTISLIGDSVIGTTGTNDVTLNNRLLLESGALREFYFDGDGSGKLTFDSTHQVTMGGYSKNFNVASGKTVEFKTSLSSSNAPTQSLSKTGQGTLILSGANSYNFDTRAWAGNLMVANNNAIGTGRLFMFNNRGTMGVYGDNDVTLSNTIVLESGGAHTFKFKSEGKGKLIFSTSQLSLGGYGKNFNVDEGTTVEFSGNVITSSKPGSPQTFIKTGKGTLIFSGQDNNYQFTTRVDEGTLLVNGKMTRTDYAVNIGTGAIIGGFGEIMGNVNVAGTMTPGDTMTGLGGNLTINGKTTFDVDSSLLIVINSMTDYAALAAKGGLDLTNTPELLLHLGFTPDVADTFDIVTGLNGNLAGTFKDLADGDVLQVGNSIFEINYLANSITLTTVGRIPEPSVPALGFLGLTLLACRRRVIP